MESLRKNYHTRALVQIAFLSVYRMFFAKSTKLLVNIFTSGLCSITSSTRNRAIAIFPTIPFTIHYKCNWRIYTGVEQSQLYIKIHSIWLVTQTSYILNTRTMLGITFLFYIMLSLTCPSEHFFHNFGSPIDLGASSTWLGAISNIPFTPCTINLKLKFDEVVNRLCFIMPIRKIDIVQTMCLYLDILGCYNSLLCLMIRRMTHANLVALQHFLLGI